MSAPRLIGVFSLLLDFIWHMFVFVKLVASLLSPIIIGVCYAWDSRNDNAIFVFTLLVESLISRSSNYRRTPSIVFATKTLVTLKVSSGWGFYPVVVEFEEGVFPKPSWLLARALPLPSLIGLLLVIFPSSLFRAFLAFFVALLPFVLLSVFFLRWPLSLRGLGSILDCWDWRVFNNVFKLLGCRVICLRCSIVL
jgi:hypothetical protein